MMIETEMAHERTLAVDGCKTKVDLAELNGLFHPYCFISTLNKIPQFSGLDSGFLLLLQCYNAIKVLFHFGKQRQAGKILVQEMATYFGIFYLTISMERWQSHFVSHFNKTLCFLREEARHNLE